MAITALSGFEPEWFEPEGQEEGEKTAFHLKPLTGPQYMEVLTHQIVVGGQIGLTAAGVNRAVDFGLIGWKNFKNADGQVIEHSPRNHIFIGPITLTDIADRIIEISELDPAQKKT